MGWLGDVVIDGSTFENGVVIRSVQFTDDQRILQNVLVSGGIGVAVPQVTVTKPHDLGGRIASFYQAD